eukprot:14287945-Ditylum_brightwellii.AAC.1
MDNINQCLSLSFMPKGTGVWVAVGGVVSGGILAAEGKGVARMRRQIEFRTTNPNILGCDSIVDHQSGAQQHQTA